MPPDVDMEEGDPRHERGSPPGRLLALTTAAFNAIGSIGIFFLMCLICLDVTGRYAFSTPIMGVTEIAEISIVAIVFVQLADTLAHERIARADSIVNLIRTYHPRVGSGFDAAAALCGFALMALIVYGTVPNMINDYNNDYYVGTVGLFTFPSWPIKAAISVGATLAGIQLLAMTLNSLTLMVRDRGQTVL
jgi:TRAP-type C4-dicarboxylate transport system permease small subunit